MFLKGLKVPVEVILKNNNFESRLLNLFNNLQRQSDKLTARTARLSPELNAATVQAAKLKKEFDRNSSAIDGLGRKLKGLFATYGGVMTIRAVVQASDVITGAENKLNYINGGDANATQEQMDKMYAAALRSRTGYSDMLTNVSKSMMLSGDAFGGNVDNAIRFQEVMAKSYAIGGASEAEQSSSMYQMIQALGSGRLQGDELRSITEGAPLAAKAIEEYAQKLYGTTDALKDMGSQGLITSEVMVDAVMNAGEGIDEVFKNTDMTIAQAFTNMKTIAMNSFRPIQDKINEFINSDAGAKFFNGMAKVIQFVMGLLNGIVSGFIWLATVITDNWNVISPILTAVGIILAMFIGYLIGVKLAAMAVNFALALAGVAGASSGLATFVAWTMANWPLLLAILLIGVVISLLNYLGLSFSEVCGYIVGAGLWMASVVGNVFIGLINRIIQSFYSMFIEPIAGFIEWLVNAFTGGFDNIGGAFLNLLGQMLSTLVGFAKPAAKLIDAVFGVNTNSILEDAQASLKSWGKNENAVTYTLKAPQLKRFDNTDAFDFGYDKGTQFGNFIGSKIDNFKNKLNLALNLTDVGGGAGKALDDTAENTGKVADSMALAEEDLEYLRKVADMEWKKEFTTAQIVVDMKNNNTINNQGDLDGWVTLLSDKLYEELGMVADGVYA